MVVLPQALEEAAEIGNCVAFVGAGFSRAAGMPSWGGLLTAILEQAKKQYSDEVSLVSIRACEEALAAGDFIVAASELRAILNPAELNRFISDELREERINALPRPVQQKLAIRSAALVDGPWAGIITTNYDTLIERALSKVTGRNVTRSITPDHNLGLALNKRQPGEMFYVKIHGSISSSMPVLTYEEYEEAYLKTSRIGNFLNAAMLVYNFVFIGSSVEEHILRLRQKLCADFGGGVPFAFCLAQETPAARRRARWMREHARIQYIFYPDGQHEAVDELLSRIKETGNETRTARLPTVAQVEEIRLLKTDLERLSVVGELNRLILDYIDTCFNGIITKEQLLAPITVDDKKWRQLRRMTADERYYRVAFLITLGLLTEAKFGEHIYYER